MTHVNHFLSLPSDLYAELREVARLRGMSLSDFMLESLMKNADAHLHMQDAHQALTYFVEPTSTLATDYKAPPTAWNVLH